MTLTTITAKSDAKSDLYAASSTLLSIIASVLI